MPCPTEPAAYERLARVLGYEDDAPADRHGPPSRRPCAATPEPGCAPSTSACSSGRCSRRSPRCPSPEGRGRVPPRTRWRTRLAAFGFADATRTRAAVVELAGGLRRSSRLMEQMLPLLLDWLSLTAGPRPGLAGAAQPRRPRPSPLADRLHLPGVAGGGPAAVPAARVEPGPGRGHRAQPRADRPDRRRRGAGPAGARHARRRDRRTHRAGRPTRSAVAGTWCGCARTGSSPSPRATSSTSTTCEARRRGAHHDGRGHRSRPRSTWSGSDAGFCVIGLGRFGGAELSYASDLDVVFVHERRGSETTGGLSSCSTSCTGPSPAERVITIDLGLRPEGAPGPAGRDLAGYAALLLALGRDVGAPGADPGPGGGRRQRAGSRFLASGRRLRVGTAVHRQPRRPTSAA